MDNKKLLIKCNEFNQSLLKQIKNEGKKQNEWDISH